MIISNCPYVHALLTRHMVGLHVHHCMGSLLLHNKIYGFDGMMLSILEMFVAFSKAEENCICLKSSMIHPW